MTLAFSRGENRMSPHQRHMIASSSNVRDGVDSMERSQVEKASGPFVERWRRRIWDSLIVTHMNPNRKIFIEDGQCEHLDKCKIVTLIWTNLRGKTPGNSLSEEKKPEFWLKLEKWHHWKQLNWLSPPRISDALPRDQPIAHHVML